MKKRDDNSSMEKIGKRLFFVKGGVKGGGERARGGGCFLGGGRRELQEVLKERDRGREGNERGSW